MAKFRIFGLPTDEISEREQKHRSLAREAASEGMVLLKNDGILPLKNRKVALYGAGARMTVRGGTGSGDVRERSNINIEQGLLAAGFTIPNTQWMDRFTIQYQEEKEEWRQSIEKKIKGYGPFRTMKMFDIIHTSPLRYPIGHAILADELTDETDTAIYVIARQAGESADRRLEKGDYLLADVEYENIKVLASHYKTLLLVINCGSMVDLSCLDEIPNIGAVLFFVQAGMEGGNAFADIVTGKNTPSGKLVDTWGKSYADFPSADTYSYLNGNLEDEDYLEGIYVGYRYFDTFGKTPRFEFGYGLSYTTFTHTVTSITVEKTKVTIRAAVRNTGGTYAGKEVLQVYMEKPAGRLDHEKRSLAAFAKTKLLAPGEETDLVISFDLTEQASFDEHTASWFLEKGEYGVTIGTSSRKNALCAVIVLDEEIATEKTTNICPMKREFTDLKSEITQPAYDKAYPRFQVTAGDITCISHRYEKPDIRINSRVQEVMARLDDDELISLCVGAGYGGLSFNYTPGVAGRTSINLLKKGIPNINLSDGPAGLNVIPAIVILKNGSSRYIDGIPEDWNWGYLKKLEPFVKAKLGRGRGVYQYMTAWPSATLQAQSWNVELVQEIGQAIGREMLEIGVSLWLAPGMNLHRNPLCGRNFEYYSEDPLISGKMAAAVTRGVQSQGGVGVSIKHMCCNNQEDNRDYVSSNLSERALRQLYLQGFRIAIREGNPWTVMSSYNRVNGVYTPNSHDLMTRVLRNEWDFNGLVMSDWNSTDKCSHANAINSGNDLIMPGNKRVRKELKKALKNGDLERDCLRTSAARVLTMIFNSAVAEDF